MTTTDLAVSTKLGAMMEAVRAAIAACDDPSAAHETIARIAAARAWARAHEKIREFRLELLTLEVDALVRVVQLGGESLLPKRDREAGVWLASKTPEERAALLADSGAQTTARGMCKAIWDRQGAVDVAQKIQRAGRAWAGGERQTVHDVMAAVMSRYERLGTPFEVADMAAAVIDRSDFDGDSDFVEGVREMCRKELGASPVELIDGTVIPRFITSKLPDGSWVRIPTMNATLSDLRETIAMRREQLAQDSAALARLVTFEERVSERADNDLSRIGDVIAASVVHGAA